MATRKSKTPTMPSMDDFGPQMTQMMAAMTRMQSHVFDAFMRQNIEMLDFLRARFERDRKLVADISAVEDPQEAARLWQDFWREAMADYSGESTKLAGIMSGVAQDAVRKVSEEATEIVSQAAKATPV